MSQNDNNADAGKPSNVYLLNVAFYSFTLFALGEMFVAISIARSRAMIADSCAMLIDSMTYLFNSWAENIKNKSLVTGDGDMSEREKEIAKLERTRQRLLLEIAPPLTSVLTLIGLTAWVGSEAVVTLLNGGEESSASEDPDIVLMFVFSGLNLVLDLVNVMCFARAKHAFGFAVIDKDHHRSLLQKQSQTEAVRETDLITDSEEDYTILAQGQNVCVDQIEENDAKEEEVNLNMCSAFTHVFADTLRSTAVLLAAGISYIFKIGEPIMVDAIASLAVSIIILMSLGPLLRGIFCAWIQLSAVKEEMMQVETIDVDHSENEIV